MHYPLNSLILRRGDHELCRESKHTQSPKASWTKEVRKKGIKILVRHNFLFWTNGAVQRIAVFPAKAIYENENCYTIPNEELPHASIAYHLLFWLENFKDWRFPTEQFAPKLYNHNFGVVFRRNKQVLCQFEFTIPAACTRAIWKTSQPCQTSFIKMGLPAVHIW